VSQKSDRRQTREAEAAYHEAELAELLAHVAEAIDRFRSGELEALDVDEVLFQYSRAAKELWKFCNIGDLQVTAVSCMTSRPIDCGNAAHQDAHDVPPTKCPPANLVDHHAIERCVFPHSAPSGPCYLLQ
jgi:hypothetical protein